jgi:thiamine biosynthesis lipoprotein
MVVAWTFWKVLLASGIVAALLCSAAIADDHVQPVTERFEAVEPHMGTLVRIQIYASGEAQAKAAFGAAFDRIAELDAILSDYRPDSELNRLPRQPGPDLFRVLEAAQQLAADTGGAFDVTLGAVTRLWRDARREHRLPDTAALHDALQHCGYRKLHLDAANRTLTVDDPALRLDVGAIAKGYAADEALSVLTHAGIHSALVAVSGDLAFSEAPPGQRGWRIDAGGAVRELSNAAVSTSGDAEQHLDIAGRRYSHIIDPATGMGLTHSVTATVIAPHGIDADGLATAVTLLGPERGLALVRTRPGASAIVR